MTARTRFVVATLVLAGALPWAGAAAQIPGARQGGPPPQGGPAITMIGGPGAERPVVAQFDANKDKRLNAAERLAARQWLETQPTAGRGRGPGGGPGGGGAQTGTPGARVSPADVKSAGAAPLYDPSTLRTLFFQFENDDWEKELIAFNNTDVEVPATLTVDGKVYKDVGLHFRGASSFFGVPEGLKHSINVTMDFVDGDQSLQGYTTLNLLNSHSDPTFLRSVLFLQAAREYLPAPKANYARVVLNGESWGIYVSAQQFNKGFINEWYKTTDGARWKVPGGPGGLGGLEYRGDDPAAYRRIFEIKSKDEPAQWAALALLCKTLNTTPADQLEKALAPMLDIDGALKFLALEVALVNNDGYWTRASDYSIYRDPKGVFHLFPHDANETFGPGGGRGGPGRMVMVPAEPPPGGRGMPPAGGPPPPPPPPGAPGGPQGRGGPMRLGNTELDPLIGLDDAAKPLRSKLLAVPALRARYLAYVKQIATKWLDWNTLGPIAQRHQALIGDEVRKDTRKLDSNEAFVAGVETLKAFAEKRRAMLLAYVEK